MALLGALAIAALACRGAPPPRARLELTLLHTNDTHARLLEFDRYGSSCNPEARAAGECMGGVARRATMVRRVRAARPAPNVLLLDAGDQFQGTLFYNRFKGREAQAVMRHLGYDAMVVGNHEFDDGPAVLARFVAGVDFPVLGSNVDAAREPALAGRIARSAVLTAGGQSVGVLGFVTEETVLMSQPGPTLRFLPIEETAAAVVAELEARGIDKIIALSHAGFERDQQVARSVAGIDVIVGGHTNTLLSNTAAGAAGPYPVVVEGPRGEPVLIVTDYAWGKFLGRLDVTFDERGVASSWSGDPILLDAQVAEDPETLALLAPMAQELEAFSSQVVGSAAVLLVGEERVCRGEECNLGNLITDAMLEATASQGIEIALHNGGGIRSSLAPGKVTVGQVLEVLPFGNAASTFELAGVDLLAALEHGVSRAENLDNDGTGRFLQVAGLRYAWSGSRPPGERIQRVEVRGQDGAWAALDPARLYRLVTNDFNRTGGDGFSMLRDRALHPYDQGRVLADILQDYLREHSPVDPRVEGRIERWQ